MQSESERRESQKLAMIRYRESHREILAARAREWRRVNPELARKRSQNNHARRREHEREYQRNYIATHADEVRARDRLYKASHKKEIAERRKRYNAEHRTEQLAYCKRYGQLHREELTKKDRGRRVKLRATARDIYGHSCRCPCGCTESNPKLLTLGHIHNDGAEDRRQNGGQAGVLQKAVKFPDKSKYITLCWSCNSGAAYNGGVCPRIGEVKKP
jgi:hypothetical protein